MKKFRIVPNLFRVSRCPLLVALLGLAAGFLFPGDAGDDPWLALERQGAVIGRIEIRVQDVFDPDDSRERHLIGRMANAVHLETRPGVIRRTLLFRAGEPVDARLIHETERLLRSLPFIRDASILPESGPEGQATALVLVHDAWSLKLGVSYGHVGGGNEWRVKFEEVNFLGFGKQIALSHEQTLDRSFNEISYRDPFLGGTRWRLQGKYQDLSDGVSRDLTVEKPFYTLFATWAAGIHFDNGRQVETVHNDGNSIFSYTFERRNLSVWYWRGIHQGPRQVQRVGVEFRDFQKEYGTPWIIRTSKLSVPDRKTLRYRGFLAGWALQEDDYRTFRNVRAIDRIEDYNLGWDAVIRLGFLPRALGSDRNAFYSEGVLRKGWLADASSLGVWDAQWQGRQTGDGLDDFSVRSRATYYDQSFDGQTLVASVEGMYGHRLDPERTIYLGGSDGLRGYPNYFRAGESRWMATLEDRVVTPWKFWGLVQVGFVGYLDVGQARELNRGAWGRVYASAGGGLRLGNLKSAFGRVILLTVAVPLVREPGLDSYQIVMGDVINF